MRTNKYLSPVTATMILAIMFFSNGSRTMDAADPESLKHLTPKEYTAVRDAVVSYAECEECESGELETVVKFGKKAIPTLVAVLKGGPSEAKIAEHEFGLRKNYQALRESAKEHPEAKISLSEQEYVNTYRDNYKALYQVRSATALAAIGGNDATEALEKASQRKDLRQDVLKVIRKLIKK